MAQVQYELSLKDGLTSKLQQADGAANKLEGTMRSLGSRVLHVAEAFGISFAMFKGIEFVHEGVEAFEKLHQAEAQVKAGLESTGHAAGIAYEELEESAKKFGSTFKFTRAEIMEMQSVMVTFPGITEKVFGDASQAIMDMSTRLHKPLDDVAIMVGKALQDPERGITAMRRVGVNFNDTQTEIIKNLVRTGQAAKAQSMILQELQTEFAGSAKAAADADPLFKFNKLMGSLKMAVGETAITLLHDLTPALEYIGEKFKQVGQFIKDHVDVLKALAVGIGVAGVAYGAYRLILLSGIAIQAAQTAWTYIQIASMFTLGAAYEGASVFTVLLTAAQYGLNAAWAANPIGIVILALAAVAAAVFYAYNHFAKFRGFLWGVWETIKEFGRIASDVFMGLWHVIHGVFTMDASEIKLGGAQSISAIFDAGNRLGSAFKKGYDGGMADFDKDKAAAAAPKDASKKYTAKAPGGEIKPETKGAKGQKIMTINIRIDSLIKDFQIRTSNIQEGANKVKEMIVQTMVGAINDSQMIGGE